MKNIIEERDANNIKRQKFKKKFDSAINLSADEGGYRLLDEGAVISGEDIVRFIIAKGTLEKYFNGENEYLPNIDENYKGYINLGHEDFYANPICLIGEWDKSDLSIVDIGGERKGLDVNVKLYDWHPYTQIIHNLPYTIGLSAEFYGHVDWEMTEALGEIVYDEICITDFAVVGYGANASSNGINLNENPKGGNMAKDKLEKLQDALEEMDSGNSEADEKLETEEPEVEETEEETEVAETEEEAEEETEEEENKMAEILEAVNALTQKVDALTEENKALKGELEKKESTMNKFAEKFKSLTIDVNPDFGGDVKDEEMSEDRYDGYSDGIGV